LIKLLQLFQLKVR